MVAYKLSKKYWVMHFFAIFRFVREKLLVTVALDHPVVAGDVVAVVKTNHKDNPSVGKNVDAQ